MLEWPTPRNLKEHKSFLGLTTYYRKFIGHYAELAGPLIDQLRKDAFGWNEEAAHAFGWNEEATHAFEALKRAMTQTSMLVMPNFTQTFE